MLSQGSVSAIEETVKYGVWEWLDKDGSAMGQELQKLALTS